ncbi:MAG: TetR/AcrR family transcriptional regulator [Roseiflexaceae bacterium]
MTTAEPSEMRQRILAEATRLFVARGFHGISMREIAEAVGVSKAGLYYHFRDKEELFLAILQACVDQLEAAIAGASALNDTRSAISQLLRGIFSLPAEQRSLMRLASTELAHLSPEARAAFGQRYYSGFIGRVETIIQSGVANGSLRPLHTRTATWALLGMAYPFFSTTERHDPAETERIIEQLITLFCDGALQA